MKSVHKEKYVKLSHQISYQVRDKFLNQIGDRVGDKISQELFDYMNEEIERESRLQTYRQVFRNVEVNISKKDKICKQIRHDIRLHDDVFLNQFDTQPFEQIKTKIYREIRNQVQIQVYREIKNNTYETSIRLHFPDLLRTIR